MKTYEKLFKGYLKEKKLKLTTERKTILGVILSFRGHFDVDQLYERLREEGKNLSRATIYRAMPLFVESGFIREVLQCRGKASYEHIFEHDHHDHLLCIECGRIIEFKNENIEKLQNEVCDEFGFEPVEHRLGIRGFCGTCLKKRRAGIKKITG